jgi:hypothetical protein
MNLEHLQRWAAGVPGETILDDVVPLEWADRSWELSVSELNDGRRSTDLAACRVVDAWAQGQPAYDLIPLVRPRATGALERWSLVVIYHSYSPSGTLLLEAEHCQN